MKISLKYIHGPGAMILILLAGCSIKFDSNVLDLAFYQWNFWPDKEASPEDQAPSCGWEDLDRGMGKLVRIPALVQDHFQGESGARVYWYHCRFTLPEVWKEKDVTLNFEGVGPVAEVYLNEEKIGSHTGPDGDFEIDVSGIIYHVRDNHLNIKLIVPEGQADSPGGPEAAGRRAAGIAGTVMARVKTTP